ncbi:MAG: hypothetical protein OEV44_06660, partial [Spirochaetota bacterium]|nr:hypothetical protein [Spirochaetota bacterium]
MMVDKQTWFFILFSLVISLAIYSILTYIKEEQFTLKIPYLIAGLVNFVVFFIAYYKLKKAI